ncbi:MAG TPA: hypothetical protein VK738_07715 [Terriglobales bacterium]|jgi:hypothetical protein|nr:hypothetical protein [Terriglobales bacterium]
MPTRIIKREEVVRVLTDWREGRMSSEEVLRWAEAFYPSSSSDVEYADWEGDNSVTNEVLSALESLDMNLALPEDAPIYLEFLTTPPSRFDVGYTQFKQQIGAIDYETRRVQLKDVPLYLRFLRK